ncbi:MAG: CPBP family intramembrane glutamic endopeptidase [Pyrobaculum sp.]
MSKLLIPILFAAAVITVAYINVPLCIKVVAGLVVYILFLPAGFLTKWRLDRRFPLAFLIYFITLVAAGFVAYVFAPIGEEYRKITEAQRQFFTEAYRCPGGFFILTIQALLLAPLVEEIIFRGILFEELKRLGLPTAYILSSLIFALLHWPGLGALPIFIMALGLAYIYQKFGLPASVLVHFLQNSLAQLAEVS